MIRFAIERYDTCADEIDALAIEHGNEVQPHGGAFKVDPDLEAWRQLDHLNVLNTVTARDGPLLVGYALSIVMPHLQFKGVKWASGDGVWLSRAWRRPRVIDRLLDCAEDSLRARSVILNVIGVHPGHPALGRILARRGYALTSLGHSRRL